MFKAPSLGPHKLPLKLRSVAASSPPSMGGGRFAMEKPFGSWNNLWKSLRDGTTLSAMENLSEVGVRLRPPAASPPPSITIKVTVKVKVIVIVILIMISMFISSSTITTTNTINGNNTNNVYMYASKLRPPSSSSPPSSPPYIDICVILCVYMLYYVFIYLERE